jgi:hypothetical protein
LIPVAEAHEEAVRAAKEENRVAEFDEAHEEACDVVNDAFAALMFVPARTAADFDLKRRALVRLYPDGDHYDAQDGEWANVLLSDASRVLGLDPLAAFAVEWEDEDEEAATA